MGVFERFTGESRFMSAISGFFELLFIGLVWLAVSLPVVTLGASTTALYYTVVKTVVHERGRLLKTFFRAFKSNFRQSTVIWLIIALYAALGAADMYALGVMGFGRDSGSIMYYISVLFFVPAAITALWVFAYTSRFGGSVGETLKYVWYLSIRNFGRTLLLCLIVGGTAAVCWLIPLISPLLPGVCCFLTSMVIEPVFKAITAERDDDDNRDKWYNE